VYPIYSVHGRDRPQGYIFKWLDANCCRGAVRESGDGFIPAEYFGDGGWTGALQR
jgi:hypothetical protein